MFSFSALTEQRESQYEEIPNIPSTFEEKVIDNSEEKVIEKSEEKNINIHALEQKMDNIENSLNDLTNINSFYYTVVFAIGVYFIYKTN